MYRTKTLLFEDRLLMIEFNYDEDYGYEIYEINDIDIIYFTEKFKSSIINNLEKLRIEQDI